VLDIPIEINVERNFFLRSTFLRPAGSEALFKKEGFAFYRFASKQFFGN
jgi:hypothetical protein